MTKQKHLTLAQSIDPSAIRYSVDNPRLVALILHIAILLLLRLTAHDNDTYLPSSFCIYLLFTTTDPVRLATSIQIA
ncbi:hypothetical protein PGT21_033676 [Puccinia graminis f. sp. tritici]|uniref:Uncharacterized protein n=1 Tax=Puccinia graminis f. sp. tritici TaxID=56615 RepID=A0A5B0PPN3_PUCGR|nr:hypothetical protein PGT21_033676 [Puccinia graminis f. sp. tritici]